MVARQLAHYSGLDYAVMSGGDVAPLGKDAVSSIHALFDWSKTSPRGVLLFVDEAEAFLAQRRDSMTETSRNALNALLFQTGTQSKNFALVLATNRPADLDAAVIDRIDGMLSLLFRPVRCLYDQLMLSRAVCVGAPDRDDRVSITCGRGSW
jgi:ATPase family AAA domain-containing protein 3A/B